MFNINFNNIGMHNLEAMTSFNSLDMLKAYIFDIDSSLEINTTVDKSWHNDADTYRHCSTLAQQLKDCLGHTPVNNHKAYPGYYFEMSDNLDRPDTYDEIIVCKTEYIPGLWDIMKEMSNDEVLAELSNL